MDYQSDMSSNTFRELKMVLTANRREIGSQFAKQLLVSHLKHDHMGKPHVQFMIWSLLMKIDKKQSNWLKKGHQEQPIFPMEIFWNSLIIFQIELNTLNDNQNVSINAIAINKQTRIEHPRLKEWVYKLHVETNRYERA